MKKKDDPFKSAPEFLAAFENVRKNGFFEKVEFHAGSPMTEGKVSHCSIDVVGCVPSSEKYAAPGCGALIDPISIVKACKNLSQEAEVKHVSVKVETENWPLWDGLGERVIGSKGSRTKMFIFVSFI